MLRFIFYAGFLSFLLPLAACRPEETIHDTATRTPLVAAVGGQTATLPAAAPTPTPTLSPTPTATPTPSPTPSATPTPTPAAPSFQIRGNPRAERLQTPVSQSGAPCGVVDLLDFPMNPPDARNIAGGQDFGVFRNRYNGHHTGEDWWGPNRRSTLGMPVYAIGHGQVTYAHPLGWGRDQGVVIIRHILPDGRQILSFYGHLDPAAVLRRAGECVARGDLIGQVGDPRTSPHLHFEIRTHAPDEPLGGYWRVDPTQAGWLPPSQFIWEQRILASPGVLWARPGSEADPIAIVNESLVLIEDGHLVSVGLENGRIEWRYESEETLNSGLLDRSSPVIYLANRANRLQAFSLEREDGDEPAIPLSPPELLWELELGVVLGQPVLLPLPAGGLVVAVRGRLFGVGTGGDLLWSHNNVGQPFDWTIAEERLLLTTVGGAHSLWEIDSDGPVGWAEGAVGYLAAGQDETVWLHSRDALYRLDLRTKRSHFHYPFPPASLSGSDMLALPDGSLLVARAGSHDRRLILWDAAGHLLWERSYAAVAGSNIHLALVNDQPYVIIQGGDNLAGNVDLFALDANGPTLTHLFAGGTRSPRPADTWVRAAGSHLVVNIGGGHLAVLNPPE